MVRLAGYFHCPLATAGVHPPKKQVTKPTPTQSLPYSTLGPSRKGAERRGGFLKEGQVRGVRGDGKGRGDARQGDAPLSFFPQGFGQIPPQRFFWFSGRRGECTRRPTKRPVQGAVTVSRCAARRVRCSSARPSFSSLFLQRAMPPPLARSCSAIHAWFARQVCHTAHPRPF